MTAASPVRAALAPLAAAGPSTAAPAALAQGPETLGMPMQSDFPSIVDGLRAFTDFDQVGQVAIGIAIAIALAATIAYHPSRSGRVTDAADVEYPKTILLFAVVGAVVAQIVRVSPAMALVVFGIGGLIRFRTRIGAPAHTGHAILATLVGIAAGMSLYLLAVVGTVTGWLLIWFGEGNPAYRLRIRGLDEDAATGARDRYRELVAAAGWTVLGEAHRPDQGKLDFYVRRPRGKTPEALSEQLQEACDAGEERFRLEET